MISSADVVVTSPGRNYVLLRVTTEDGLVGWGDATLNGRELAVASYLRDHVVPLLVGRDAHRVEDTWQYLYRGAYWRRGPVTMAAIGAVDTALWDLKGKAAGLPVYQLLGGAVREGVYAYAHAFGWDHGELVASVDRRLAEGFRAVRVQFGVPGLDAVYGVHLGAAAYEPAGRGRGPLVERWAGAPYLRHAPGALAAIRDHVGPDVDLLHDVHHRLTPVEAARLAKDVEPIRLFWLEDVTPAENHHALDLVRQHSTTPLAIGETFTTIWDCQELLVRGSIDYIRAAVTHAGGLSHVRRIADLAALHGVRAAPHGPSDLSPINLAASLHLALSTHNVAIQEYMGHPGEAHEVFRTAYTYADGYLHPGDEPGLGVEVDLVAAERFPYEPAYLPVARTVDGTVWDW
ncbi:D-galactonate dehydratase family protein [Georgenia sp. TF02-10]|nr:D-galactonate dehydratase family protein [Georgenia sp. TF02-10]